MIPHIEETSNKWKEELPPCKFNTNGVGLSLLFLKDAKNHFTTNR